MSLQKLRIVIEKASSPGKGRPQFDNNDFVEALFNPDKLVFNKTANWEKQDAKNNNGPEMQFKNSEPRTLTIDLLFDTYDTPDVVKKDVRREYTDKIMKLIMIEREKHRPPVCRLFWGKQGMILQGVLTTLGQQFTMFTDDGTPVRARLNCSFKEWKGNVEGQKEADECSADLAKRWIVKDGDSLSRIATVEYGDPREWRPIAEENGLDDPFALTPGTMLAIPTLPFKRV